jgi:hypothetical protein
MLRGIRAAVVPRECGGHIATARRELFLQVPYTTLDVLDRISGIDLEVRCRLRHELH